MGMVWLVLLALSWTTVTGDSSGSSLPGHRQPIGNHRPPELPIDEFSEPISGEVFFQRYVSRKQPVVFRNFVRQWPAFKKWTDDYIRKEFGKLHVKVEPKVDGSGFGAEGALGIGRDTLENFAATYTSVNKYVVSELPSPMYKDVLVAPCMTCGELRDSLVEIDLWWSNGGSRSRLHRDAFNAINCQVNGTKEWIMINNNETDNVYFVASSKWEMGGLSPIDVDDVDLKEFERFADVKYGKVTINAGDCLFIPGGHYHQVKSTGDKNLAVSVLFGRLRSFNGTACEGHELKPEPLDKLDVFWAWPGTGIKYMGRGDDHFFKMWLEDAMDKKKQLTKKALRKTYTQEYGYDGELADKTAEEVLKIIDHDKDGIITVNDLNATNRFDWRNISFILEGEADLQNGFEFELGIVDYWTLRNVVESLASSKTATRREEFLKKYRGEPVYGSAFRGNQLFDKLDQNGDGQLTKRELRLDFIRSALQPYEMDYEGNGGIRSGQEGDEEGGPEEDDGEDDFEGEEEEMDGEEAGPQDEEETAEDGDMESPSQEEDSHDEL